MARRTYYESVAECLDQAISKSEQLVVIAYSGGGHIFYRWLALSESQTYQRRIQKAILIASPYQCKKRKISLEGREIPFLDEAIDSALIVKNLDTHRLHVLLAKNDTTILRQDAEFDDYKKLGVVSQEEIDTTHDDICSNQKTIDYIIECLRDILSA